ncbi:MAG: hypothetical protein O3C63_03010 [Cyanobacteria bacterium]|nr:hypothetical protein [Cyanobacteriota bacterium]MDA1020036.1 hypothetical protein [Cyanobacteriota bacterium]
MDIKGINSNESTNAMEQILLYGNKSSSKEAAKTQSTIEPPGLDQAQADVFNAVKAEVRAAGNQARAKMVAELRQQFLAGELNAAYQGTDIADSLLADGYGEFLVT